MLQVKINGMSCNHCITNVKNNLEENGGKNVVVDLEKKLATWEGDLTFEQAKEIIEDLGFDVVV